MWRRSQSGVTLACAVVALGLAACGRDPHLPGDQVDERGVVILQPWDVALYTQSTARVLAAAFPGAESAALSRFDQVFSDALARRRVVILPHLDSLPCEVWKPLENFLDAGGCALLWGAQPFAERVWTSSSGLQRERDLEAALVGEARPASWSDPQLWWPASEPAQTIVTRRPAAASPWPAVEVDSPTSAERAGFAVSFAPDPAVARDALIFFAHGDARTPRLQVEVRDVSGTWWRAACELGAAWRPVLLPMGAFAAPAGSDGAPLTADQIASIYVGVEGGTPDATDAPHRFGLSEVRWVRDPRPAWPRAPDLPGVPQGAGSTGMRAASLDLVGGASRPLKNVEISVQQEPVRGCGEEQEGAGRLIPVARAVGSDPDRSGVCAQVYADRRPGRPLRRYGWLSLDAATVGRDPLRDVLRALVARLQNGHLILQSGMGAATIPEGREMVVHYRHESELGRAGQPVRINVEMLDAGGRVVRRVSAAPRGAELQRLDLGRAPSVQAGPLDFVIRLRVINPSTVTILDEVAWPLRVVGGRDHVPPRRPVEASGSQLVDTGRPVFPLIQTWDEPAGARRALAVENYPAGHVADWLDRAREIGLNAVAVTVDRSDLLPQYQHLAGELESRRMFALVRLACFPVLHTDWPAARALALELARCQTDPVVAFDIASPASGPRESDAAWASAWAGWLTEQFGSLEQAADALGCASAEEATAAWGRPASALAPGVRLARRRCHSDITSRHVAAVRGLLRACGLLHALTLSPPGGGEGADPAGAASHLDVLTAEVDLRAPADALAGAGFAAAWARGMAGGRPVWWMERGPGTPARAGEVVLQDQGARWSRFFQLLRRTSAAGGWLAPTEDGSPPFLCADGADRPAAAQARAFSHQLRGSPLGQAAAWRDRVVEAWSEAGGWPGLCVEWAPRYGVEAAHGEFVELRPAGFGVETRRLDPHPLLRTGAVVPWQELNAEWTGALVNGEPLWRAPGTPLTVKRRDKVQLTVCNTGSATWTPWTAQPGAGREVRATVSDAGTERETLRVPRLAMGQSGVVEWTPFEPGLRQLRVTTPATGPWGEALSVRVLP